MQAARMRKDTEALAEDLGELVEIRSEISEQLHGLQRGRDIIRVMLLAGTHCVCYNSEPMSGSLDNVTAQNLADSKDILATEDEQCQIEGGNGEEKRIPE
uniref:Uncharacterized protein n=1 Tax=Mycena chlorophos TaxID=658473 RepID=A0ABQ0LGB7_MYCCL|nr:predicted protein [Mycena chlorophos]